MKWLLCGLLSVLPLQWFVIARTPLGVGRLHEIAALLFAVIVLSRYKARTLTPIAQVSLAFVFATAAWLLVWGFASMLNGLGINIVVTQVLRAFTAVAVAVVVYRIGSGKERGGIELLRWVGLSTVAVFLAAMIFSMSSNGVNPVLVLSQTITSGNPELIEKSLFRDSFGGFGLDPETVQGNLRHEVFCAVLLSMEVAGWAVLRRPVQSVLVRRVLMAALVVGVLLLLISLSRSALLAAALWPALLAVRAFLRMRLSWSAVTGLAVAGALVVAGAITGFSVVFTSRFTQDTASYETRGNLYDEAFANIASHPLLGGVSTVGESSHNFLIDAWLRGGLFTFIAGLAMSIALVALWLRLVLSLGTEPAWMVPVAAALGIPIVRMFTSGGGLIPPVGWIAIGFVFGVLAAWSTERNTQSRAGALVRRRDGVPA